MKKIIFLFSGLIMSVMLLAQIPEFSPARKLAIAEAAINRYYVDSVNESKLVEDAIRGMLEELDPHSSYSTTEETIELNEPLQGNFSGIGISFNMDRDTLYVIQTIPGGPAEKVGMLAGDRIIIVNDTAIAGVKMKRRDIMKRLRGPKGTDVDVKALRRSSGSLVPDTVDFRITRDEIPIYSVDAAYIVEPGIGYIRINKFAAETAAEVRKAITDLKKKGMKDLILDLEDNGGGFLYSAVELLGELLEPGSLAVYTEGLNSPRQNLTASPYGKKPLLGDGRLVVMVNQNSASASEITAGAIQDWDRGVIVGRRTFGKGLVQRPFPFPDGSMIRLTIAHYYTPTERDIQKPYKKGNGKDYARDISDRFDHGELMHEDSIPKIDSLKVHTMIKRRSVYGGGGITPDRFVPLDTLPFTKFYRDVQAKGIFNQFVFKYLDDNRKQLKKKYPSDTRFVEEFEISDPMLDEFRAMAVGEGVKENEEEYLRSKENIRMLLKALIGRDMYENATFFKVFNAGDPIFKEALKVIKGEEYKQILDSTDKLVN